MIFEQCKIVIFHNIIFMKKHRKIFRKNSMEIFRNFPEKYEIFRTHFPPHITNILCALSRPTYVHQYNIIHIVQVLWFWLLSDVLVVRCLM